MTNLVQPVDRHREDAFVACHSEGHQWRHQGLIGAPDWMPPFGMMGAIARHSLCTSCGTERARWYTRSGEATNRYRAPEGYYHKRQTPDDYAPTRLEWRQRLVVTLFAQFEERTSETPRKAPRKRRAS